MKPITSQLKISSRCVTPKVPQPLPPIASTDGCVIKKFSKVIQCVTNQENPEQEMLDRIKINKLKSAEMVLAKASKNVEEHIVKNISKEFIFEESVIEEWSPHQTPYKNAKLSKLYTDLDKLKSNKKLPSQRGIHHKHHMPCHLTPIKDEYDNTVLPKQEHSFLLLGVSNSEERLKQIPRFSSLSIDTLKQSEKDELKPMKKSPYGWEEHVLSLISKSTASLIIKDSITQNQQALKLFLEKKEKEKETEIMTEKTLLINENIEANISQNILDSSAVEKFESVPTHNLLHDLNKVKPATKQYENVLQESYPFPPNQWSHVEIQNNKKVLKKGIQKWTSYPKEIKEEELVLQQASSHNFLEQRSEEIDLKTATKQRSNTNLLLAVDEWRSKWLLEKNWQTKTFDEIKEAMKSINVHVRLAAVSAGGKVILDRRNDKKLHENEIKSGEDDIVSEMKKLYNDESLHVVVATAVTLYTINRADQKATDLLLDTVKHGAPSERWMAVQCLAKYGHHDDCIIVELLSHAKMDCEPFKRKKVEKFLRNLSNLTDSIQYMLSEQLNSTSWKDRFSSCQMLPVLNGTLRKDIANKLSYLTWYDWSKNVRMAAAVALGRTGNGKLIHDALCKYLISPNTLQQMEALRMVSKLGIVTAQLISPFLQCMKSHKDTVCLGAIRVVHSVGLCGDDVVKSLTLLATSERSLKIRVGAVKTLGTVCENDKREVRDCLLWMLHYEKHHLMREAACEAIEMIGFNDSEIIYTMQDMLVVEENENIKRKVGRALESLGFEKGCDDNVMTTVRERVKTLCEKNNMLLHILADSKSELEMYLRQQNEKVEDNDVTENSTNDVVSDAESDDAITRNFDTTLEAYRARNVKPPSIELPTMQEPYIPYWKESNQSVSFEKD